MLAMKRAAFLGLLIFLQPFEQKVVKEVIDAGFTINSSYGSLTMNPDNITHTGTVDVCFIKEVAAFKLTHLILNDSAAGNVIYKGMLDTCDEKSFSNIIRMMKRISGDSPVTEVTEIVPATWICPIKKGNLTIKAEPKTKKFSLFVPSFFSNEGSFTWNLTYETVVNEKPEIFLKSYQKYNVKFADN